MVRQLWLSPLGSRARLKANAQRGNAPENDPWLSSGSVEVEQISQESAAAFSVAVSLVIIVVVIPPIVSRMRLRRGSHCFGRRRRRADGSLNDLVQLAAVEPDA